MEPQEDVSTWLRGAVEGILPEALDNRNKIRRGFDLVALASLFKTANWENRWREIDSVAAHRQLYGEDPADVKSKEMSSDDMLVLGNVIVNEKEKNPPLPPPPAPPSRSASASPLVKYGLGTMLAVATGSGLVGAAVPAVISALSPKGETSQFEDTVLIPELTGDWEKVEQ